MALKITDKEIKEVLAILDKKTTIDVDAHFTPYTWLDYFIDTDFATFYKGCSKLVLTLEEYDNFVIKIPFNGYSPYEDEVENADEEELEDYEYDYDNQCYFRRFCMAYCDECWDYCAVESIRYEKAKSYGVEKLFAETRKIGNLYGYPIYVQEKAIAWSDCYNLASTSSQKSMKRASQLRGSLCGNIYEFETDWLAYAIDIHTDFLLESLSDFISDTSASDFHDGNYGVSDDEKNMPLIFDYSDYRDGFGYDADI